MMAMLLQAGATVTICHSQTKRSQLPHPRADMLVAAVGRPKFVTADMVKPGAVVIDVGINRLPDGKPGRRRLRRRQGPSPAVSITPVPGGVGPMTITMLLANTLEAAESCSSAKHDATETSRRRRRHGLRLRLADHAGRGRDPQANSACPSRRASSRRTVPRPALRLCRDGGRARGLKAIIAGAGGAAHLPGMLAKDDHSGARRAGAVEGAVRPGFAALHRADAEGHSVATFAIGEAGAANAALFAVSMLANHDAELARRLAAFPPDPDREGAGHETAGSLILRNRHHDELIPPARHAGMLGGGQLGRFFVSAAHEMGYKVWVLDPDPHSPAGQIADRHLQAAYDDYAALDELADGCAAVTTEFETSWRIPWTTSPSS